MSYCKFLFAILLLLVDNELCMCLNSTKNFGSFKSESFSVNWTSTTQFNTFSIETKISDGTQVYVAIGFSNDQLMGDDGVVYCSYSNGIGKVSQAYNDGKMPTLLNESDPSIGIKNASVSFINGTLLCSFQRLKAHANQSNYFNLAKKYYLLCAKGQAPNDMIQYHRFNDKLASGELIDFESYGQSNSTSAIVTSYKVKVHSCLMAFAWMVMATTGILFARYYKFIFPSVMLFKVKFWFNIHRLFMTSVPLLSLIAFIFILADLNWKWIDMSNRLSFAHSITGIITIFLSFIQIPIAMLRPGLEHPRRFIFNICHRSIGLTALLLSIVTIFLGVCLQRINLGDWGWDLMIAYCLWFIMLPVIMELLSKLYKKRRGIAFEIAEAKDLQVSNVVLKENESKFERDKLVLLIFNTMVTLTIAINLIAAILNQ